MITGEWLHIPSYNMGMAAGLAWKAAGKEHFYVGDLKEDDPRSKWLMSVLELSDKLDMFMPSSYLEGFHNAFTDKPYFING